MANATSEEQAADLAARLEAEPDIAVAYLFGSRARGNARPNSDVDVGVLLDAGVDIHRRQLDLMASLGANVDLVVLNDAPPALGYRVLRDGIVLVCHDDRARVEHWVRTVDRYLDTAPMRRTLEEGLRHRIAEGRFGRS